MSKLAKVAVVAGLGVAAGMLLAPKSGKENRNDLKKKVEQAKKYVNEKAEQAQEMASEAKDMIDKDAKKVKRMQSKVK
jgi:gas vesicle protein